MKRFRLVCPDVTHALQLLDSGQGDVSDYEVMKAMIDIAEAKGDKIEFFREEPSGDVVISPQEMTFAIENQWEMRPIPPKENN